MDLVELTPRRLANRKLKGYVNTTHLHCFQCLWDMVCLFRYHLMILELIDLVCSGLIFNPCSAETLKALRDTIQQDHTTYDYVNVSHALSRVAKLQQSYYNQLRQSRSLTQQVHQQVFDDYIAPCLQLLNPLVQQHIDEFEPWDVALCLWSYAQLNSYHKQLFDQLCQRGIELYPLMKPVDCANIMVAFGKFGHYHPTLLKGISQVKPCNRMPDQNACQ